MPASQVNKSLMVKRGGPEEVVLIFNIYKQYDTLTFVFIK